MKFDFLGELKWTKNRNWLQIFPFRFLFSSILNEKGEEEKKEKRRLKKKKRNKAVYTTAFSGKKGPSCLMNYRKLTIINFHNPIIVLKNYQQLLPFGRSILVVLNCLFLEGLLLLPDFFFFNLILRK